MSAVKPTPCYYVSFVAGATRLELSTAEDEGRSQGVSIRAQDQGAHYGHLFRGKGIAERYGKISDQELVDAIDRMKFENGETEV